MKSFLKIILVFIIFISVKLHGQNDTCSIKIPNDTIIYSTTPIQYQLSTDQSTTYYRWIPSLGLSDPTIRNPIATVSGTSQYILEAMFEIDSNLVYNGDFELGNVGFTTQMQLSYSNPTLEGFYNIVTVGDQYHWGFEPCTNGGNFFAGNGAYTPNTAVYQNTVNVIPNTDYVVSFEVTNLCNTSIQSQIPIFQFSINSQQIGSNFVINQTPCVWNKYYQIWNSGSNTTAVIKILNQNTQAGGNDFGLDNVSFKRICKAYDTITISVQATQSIDSCYIKISNDTILYSNTPIQYQLYSTPQADLYYWSPTYGLSTPNSANPIATISTSQTYILKAGFINGPNLVYNGDFELGNTGFVTQYSLGTKPLQEGEYGITNYGPNYHNNFSPCIHNGNFFAGNASLSSNTKVFQSTPIAVTPNTDYYFSADVTKIDFNTNSPVQHCPVFKFMINGVQQGATVTTENNPCVWTQFGYLWNSGSDTSAIISVIDVNTGQWGNDFAIDNISLNGVCYAYDTINIEIVEIADIMFPNVVTSNSDGINDVFEIHNLIEKNVFLENELYVFNRQGKEIYSVINITKKSDFWDPRKTNSPIGTYFYRFIGYRSGRTLKRNGIIEVIR